MKKILSAVLAAAFFAILSVNFSACSSENDESTKATQSAENSAQGVNLAENSQNLVQNSPNSSENSVNLNPNSQNSAENSANSAANSTQKSVIKAFATMPPLTALLEILHPQGMIGLNYKPYPEDTPFLPAGVATLPVLGKHGDMNYEQIVALKPDVIIFSKPIDKAFAEPYEKIGIKVLGADFDFTGIEENIRLYGETFGVQERAEKLLAFHKKTQELLSNLREKVAKKPRIYFALGIEGLQSECVKAGESGDLATLIGGENVVKCEQITTSKSILPMNFETLIALNPDAIFVREIGLYKDLKSGKHEQWQRLGAIKNGRFYYAPSSPSNWLMRPPTLMRMIGYPWAFSKLHPELLPDAAVRGLAKEFFAEFLRPISDEDYDNLEGK